MVGCQCQLQWQLQLPTLKQHFMMFRLLRVTRLAESSLLPLRYEPSWESLWFGMSAQSFKSPSSSYPWNSFSSRSLKFGSQSKSHIPWPPATGRTMMLFQLYSHLCTLQEELGTGQDLRWGEMHFALTPTLPPAWWLRPGVSGLGPSGVHWPMSPLWAHPSGTWGSLLLCPAWLLCPGHSGWVSVSPYVLLAACVSL